MRILPAVPPTPEQLTILADERPGYTLIRGAAGSGKTTTALLRLRQLCSSWVSRRDRLGLVEPVRVLVLTYNRTLEGYIAELARQQVVGHAGLQLEVRTFGKWAYALTRVREILDREDSARLLHPLVAGLPQSSDFLIEEIEYFLSRFPPDQLNNYLTARRDGRGIAPRVEQPLRLRLLRDVVPRYVEAKQSRGVVDWNDVAVAARRADGVPPWDVIVIDEAQDFSANQLRAVQAHCAEPFSMTFVMDAVQRIYPRFFAWREVGIELNRTYTLRRNYRNTRQIAAFARPLVEGLPLEDDGALPNFEACTADGPLPLVVSGAYSAQIDYIVDHILKKVDFASDSVAFLQPRGGAWFNYLRSQLRSRGLPWAELTRASFWPTGPESIALSTLHSAKGLEFDHVILPGLNAEVTPHGQEEGDVQFDTLRRLIAMGVGRARKSLIVGFKPSDPSSVLGLLRPGTYELVTL